jgi:hypothetical protein
VPFGGALISSARLRRRLIRLARDRARIFGVRRRLVLRAAAAEVGLIGLALDRRNVAPDSVLPITCRCPKLGRRVVRRSWRRRLEVDG